jgi:hypothetical protein
MPPRIAERLTLVGMIASLLVAFAGAVALRQRARTVDIVAACAGVAGAVASLVAWRVQRRRALRPPTVPSRAG